MESIGSIIKKRRNEMKLTMMELSEKIGCSDAYINQIEKDKKTPPEKTILIIGKALNLNDTEIKNLLFLLDLEKTPERIRHIIKTNSKEISFEPDIDTLCKNIITNYKKDDIKNIISILVKNL